tara:strand:- start:6957 stop:8768 length:1812 start_codon:yes stop_codon:yes gene_type:complete
MIILGINDTHDASACILKNGEIISAIAEERCQRLKNIAGFPYFATKEVLKEANLKKNQIDIVAVANINLTQTNLWSLNSNFQISDFIKLNRDYFYKWIYTKNRPKLIDIFPNYKPKGKYFYPLKKIPFITSHESNKKINKNMNLLRLNYISKFLKIDKSKIFFFDHHHCHSLYSYFFSKKRFNHCAIVTADGGGDGKYDSVSIVKNNKFKTVSHSRTNLIGKFYSSITLLLGMNPSRHHYKVMGLAPYCKPYHKKKPLKVFLEAMRVKNLKFVRNKNLRDYYFYFKDRLEDCRFDGIAGGLQEFTEIRLKEWFRNIYKKYKVKKFIFNGGVANNVKANKILTEQKFIEDLFVPPGPGDENLSIGAAFAYINNVLGFKKAKHYIKKVESAYLGTSISKKNFDNFRKNNLIRKNYFAIKDFNQKKAAKLVASGETIVFCNGKMEFGARALGARSFLSDPSNLKAKKKLNDLIKKRDFWMPFTPSILEEDYSKYIVNPKKITSEYMTIAFDTTKKGQSHLKAAIHPEDLTVRPQMVRHKINPSYYNLIKEFKKITGIGAVLNTSLNLHEKPIVSKPVDIINEFLKLGKNYLKYIYIKDTLYILKTK